MSTNAYKAKNPATCPYHAGVRGFADDLYVRNPVPLPQPIGRVNATDQAGADKRHALGVYLANTVKNNRAFFKRPESFDAFLDSVAFNTGLTRFDLATPVDYAQVVLSLSYVEDGSIRVR